MRQMARNKGIDHVLSEYKVDVIIGPSDGPLQSMAACAGYPIVQMPLSYLNFNGRPLGLSAVTVGGRDEVLIRFLSAWESTMPSRKPPPPLVESSSSHINVRPL